MSFNLFYHLHPPASLQHQPCPSICSITCILLRHFNLSHVFQFVLSPASSCVTSASAMSFNLFYHLHPPASLQHQPCPSICSITCILLRHFNLSHVLQFVLSPASSCVTSASAMSFNLFYHLHPPASLQHQPCPSICSITCILLRHFNLSHVLQFVLSPASSCVTSASAVCFNLFYHLHPPASLQHKPCASICSITCILLRHISISHVLQFVLSPASSRVTSASAVCFNLFYHLHTPASHQHQSCPSICSITCILLRHFNLSHVLQFILSPASPCVASTSAMSYVTAHVNLLLGVLLFVSWQLHPQHPSPNINITFLHNM